MTLNSGTESDISDTEREGIDAKNILRQKSSAINVKNAIV